MDALKNFFIKLWYSLPFAMKGGDDAIQGETSSLGVGTTISQEVSDKTVAKHLLKGEVTQEVEELRYRTYKVADESKKYKYIGNGVAIKGEERKKKEGRYKFSQENEMKLMGIIETLSYVDKELPSNYDMRIDITYSDVMKFKLEKFMTHIDVDINESEDIILTKMHFSCHPNPDKLNSKAFIHYLEAIKENFSKQNGPMIDIKDSLLTLSFSTYKANGEDDFVNYSFIDGAELVSIEKTEHEFILSYEWKSYIRLEKDLTSKYYSKTMDEKYKTKARKDVAVDIANTEKRRFCYVCGNEISGDNVGFHDELTNIYVCKDCKDGKKM